MFKRLIKKTISSEPIAKVILKLNRVVAANYKGDLFTRFDDSSLFAKLSYGTMDATRGVFGDKKVYILTDRPCGEGIRRKLGPVITSLDGLSDDEIANSVFYIYFLCDSDALASLQRISSAGGKYVPHMSFSKTDYRFTDRLVHNAMRKTWAKRERVSHLTPIVHENLCEALSITKHLEGDYVEIGVFRGGSALTAINFLGELLKSDSSLPRKKAWLLDTFDGFNYDAAFASPDAIWAGTHRLSGQQKTMAYIDETLSGTEIPYQLVASNICEDSLPADIKKISVANVDVDMYEPTLAALFKVSDLVVPGGIIVCEDPASTPGLYGAYQAMEEFLGHEKGKAYCKIFKQGQYFLLKMPQGN